MSFSIILNLLPPSETGRGNLGTVTWTGTLKEVNGLQAGKVACNLVTI